jgi:hypothetical protein
MGRGKHKRILVPISKLELDFPKNLIGYFNGKQALLLKCYLAGYNLREMCAETGYKREEILQHLISVGRGLALFELMEHSVVPSNVLKIPEKDRRVYLQGWSDYKKTIREEVNVQFRKTVKN